MCQNCLAGGLLSYKIHDYYRVMAKNEFKDQKGMFKKEFIKWVTGHEIFVASIKSSLQLARVLVDEARNALGNAGFSTLTVGFRLLGRGLVGTGDGLFKTIFEVGLIVDPLLGLPYYPASTLKGASRAACEELMTVYGGEKPYLEPCDMLFGSRDSIGLIVFTNAYPIGCLRDHECMVYTGDIVNPHYYQGGEPVESESDASPVPVMHLSIGENLVFYTVLASYSNVWPEGFDYSRVPSKLQDVFSMGPLYTVSMFMLAALISGFAARSSKGYNIAQAVKEDLLAEVTPAIAHVSFRSP